MTGKLIAGEEAERIGSPTASRRPRLDAASRRWSTSCWPARRSRSASRSA